MELKYRNAGNDRLKMINLPNKRIFCFNYLADGQCYSWFMTNKGKCMEARDGYFNYESFADQSSCVISFEEYWIRNNIESWVDPRNYALGISENDKTICVGMTYLKHFYLIKYDLEGQILKQKMNDSHLVNSNIMLEKKFFTCVEQQSGMINKNFITGTAYWGFDCRGNFFVEVY